MLKKLTKGMSLVLLIEMMLIYSVFVSPRALASTTIDDFEAYSTGALAGQGLWTGNSDILVSTLIPHAGANSVLILDDNSDAETVTRTFGPGGTGNYGYYARVSSTGSNAGDVAFKGDGVVLSRISWEGGTYNCNGGGGTIASIADTNYHFLELYLDVEADQVKCRVDGGTYTTLTNFVSDHTATQVDTVVIESSNVVGAITYHYDDFQADVAFGGGAAAPEPPSDEMIFWFVEV